MNDENRKNVAMRLCYSVTSDNVAKIYLNNFNDYLYQNSDKVEINGIVIGNSIEDKMLKIKMRFPDKNGNPNIKTAIACGTRAGFPITELDFIDNQLTILKGLSFTDFVQRKKYETYLNFIQNKKNQPQPEPKLTNTPQQQNIKNQLQKEINGFSFFQIDIVGSIVVDGKIYENVTQRNNDSIITTENWNERKLEFFNQRMSNYEDSFSQTEKIELEIENLNKEEFETDNHKILKKRYLDLLNDKLNNTPHPQTQENEIEHPFSSKTNFELFKYLDEWFKPRGKKAKYTYIFNHFKDNDFEPLLSQNTYLEFVMSFKNIKIADRLQGAPSNKIDAEINRLVSEFKKSNS